MSGQNRKALSFGPFELSIGNRLLTIGTKVVPLGARAMDILIAAALLLLLTPVFLSIAFCIRAESKGPALFRQRRGGLAGRPFMV